MSREPGWVEHRRKTASEYIAADDVLKIGEVAIESDTNKIKLGDGSSTYSELSYLTVSASDLESLFNTDITLSIEDWDTYDDTTILTENVVYWFENHPDYEGNIFVIGDGTTALSDLTIYYPNNTEYEAVQLKAISTTDQTVSTDADGAVPTAETTQESNNITITDGEITFDKAGFYRMQVQLNLSTSNNTTVEAWAEYYDSDTTSWVTLDDSGYYIESSATNEGNTYFETSLSVTAGFQIRLKIRVDSGSATLDSVTLSNGVVVPSVTYIAYKLPTH